MDFGVLAELFLVFFKIGFFMMGGGYTMISLAKYELVIKRKWLSDKEFLDILAIAESTPGPISLNIATYVGFKKAGILGALVATTALALPAFAIILAIASALLKYYDSPLVQSALKGVRGAVVGLVAGALISIANASISGLSQSQVMVTALIAFACFVAFHLLRADPVILIVVSAIIGLALGLAKFW
ncbi:MAG: chromate transporter [Acidilobaceae archaeon]